MTDQPPESRPVLPPDPDANPTQAIPAQNTVQNQAQNTAAKQRLRDRLWSFRAVIAVALASVIIGGLGGAALANVSEGDDGTMRFHRGGPGGPPGMMNRGPQGRNPWQGRNDGPGVPPNGPTPPTPSPTR
jgi:hypothetical protein